MRPRKKPNLSWDYQAAARSPIEDDGQIDITAWLEGQTPERINVAMERAKRRYIDNGQDLEDAISIELTTMAAYDIFEGEVLLGHRTKVVQEDGTIEYQAV